MIQTIIFFVAIWLTFFGMIETYKIMTNIQRFSILMSIIYGGIAAVMTTIVLMTMAALF